MGTAADVFGDIVYDKAYSGPNPPLEGQMKVYADLQTLLSKAITNLAATGPTNVGPGGTDLVYGGSRTKWTALAYTLKARYYMHTAEVDPSAYANAYTASLSGIQTPAR